MIKTSKTKVATEDFVYRIVANTEKRIEKRFDDAEELAEKRFNKLMDQMASF